MHAALRTPPWGWPVIITHAWNACGWAVESATAEMDVRLPDATRTDSELPVR